MSGDSPSAGNLGGEKAALPHSFLQYTPKPRPAPPGLTPFPECRRIGRRKALFIGINYFGQRGQLRESIQDVKNLRAYLIEYFDYKHEDIVILTDDKHNSMSQPTKQNILRAMHWLVKDANPDDSLFFYYSGHEGPTKDNEDNNDAGEDNNDGDEDGYSSTIVPVDFQPVGYITNEEMHRIMVEPLQAGVKLTAIFDTPYTGGAPGPTYIYSAQSLLKEPQLAEKAKQDLHNVAPYGELSIPTDSGYASAAHAKRPCVAPLLSHQENIVGLADDLFNKVNSWDPNSNTKERISKALPDLLKNFALKVGHNAKAQVHRNVMAYIHKHRHKIAEAFAEMCSHEGDSLETAPPNSEEMCLEERMNLWLEKGSFEETRRDEWDLVHDTRSEDSSLTTDDETVEHLGYSNSAFSLTAYRNLVVPTAAYQWLLGSLQREFRLMPTEPNAIQIITRVIASVLPPIHNISSKTVLDNFRVRFYVDWNPIAFLVEQQYKVKPAEAFEGVITVTGTCQDAQAATTSEYMKQTWPATGDGMLLLVKQVLRREPGSWYSFSCLDDTDIFARIDGPNFVVEVAGGAKSIAETGEQLAWLGAALRPSTRHRGLVCCMPIITQVIKDDTTPRMLLPPQFVFQIGFATEEVEEASQPLNGQCWYDLFRNPVVVKGYPILRKENRNTGLEVPLSILAALAGTRRIDHFKESYFLKGFSTLLVPTMLDGDILSWHLVFNQDGNRISYLNSTIFNALRMTHLGLGSLRHVVGWCSEAHFYGGSVHATYNVGYAGLPRAYGNGAFSNIRVSAGQLIVGGPSFHIGLKDTPAHVARGGYIPRLKWISSKLILLWDEADKRGWLINGTSALLHIVRASLTHDSSDKFKSAFIFKNEDLQESSTLLTADSAVDVLINPNNMRIKLYPEKDGHLTLESRIDHYYNILEKLIDHQTEITGYNGMNMIEKPRRSLGGWDFTDLATNRDPLYPRIATIEAKGKGWIDFIRTIHTVTLIGRGFGEIIQPTDTNHCEYWSKLPKHNFYIAACISDLSQIISENTCHNDIHVRLSENLIWHTPTALFESCHCRGALGSDHSEPVQTLLPSSLSSILLPRKYFIPHGSQGAVIFGYHSTFRWVWGDTGNPNEGGEVASSSDTSVVDSFNDSGVGTSLTSSALGRSKNTSYASPRTPIHSSNDLQSRANPLKHQTSIIDSKLRTRSEYTVGILCALPKELMAVRALFDKRHDNVNVPSNDSNHYALGEICHHMVVATGLPAGEIGTNSAAHSISNMYRSFPSLRRGFCLLPSHGPSPGVLQYDRGKEKENASFELTGSLAPPPRCLMSAISSLRSDPDLPPDPLGPYLQEIASRLPEYRYPGQDRDRLFKTLCSKCQALEPCPASADHIKYRIPRLSDQPQIHYGLIASGNRVLKDSKVRDSLARDHGVLCFEMEAAGVMNAGLDCLVIRGISDYADAAKNKEWQEYAAASAAAYAKLLLGVVASKNEVDGENELHVTPAKRSASELDISGSHEWPPSKRRR
ncbi:hypothetical protein GGR51DRAFT_566969 [Nemania sp. FL0031]|nr:hypothetical protein GGR51DRAFT_566969 [Nemania sp. FL0031]